MPSLQENLEHWNEHYDWSQGGEEWSWRWGASAVQWHGVLMPRLSGLLPARRVLEIGPGFGRWTAFLAPYTERLFGVDLSQKCIDACRQRFADDPRLEFHLNDGRSLSMLEERSIDLAFSFDSLVHAEADAVGDYLQELVRVLADDGVGFFHHSNLGAYPTYFRWVDRLPFGKMALYRAGLVDIDHWRARSLTAEGFAELCRAAGLVCVRQELINWGKNRRLIDCISTFTRPGSSYDRPPQLLRNGRFMRTADALARTAKHYGDHHGTAEKDSGSTAS